MLGFLGLRRDANTTPQAPRARGFFGRFRRRRNAVPAPPTNRIARQAPQATVSAGRGSSPMPAAQTSQVPRPSWNPQPPGNTIDTTRRSTSASSRNIANPLATQGSSTWLPDGDFKWGERIRGGPVDTERPILIQITAFTFDPNITLESKVLPDVEKFLKHECPGHAIALHPEPYFGGPLRYLSIKCELPTHKPPETYQDLKALESVKNNKTLELVKINQKIVRFLDKNAVRLDLKKATPVGQSRSIARHYKPGGGCVNPIAKPG